MAEPGQSNTELIRDIIQPEFSNLIRQNKPKEVLQYLIVSSLQLNSISSTESQNGSSIDDVNLRRTVRNKCPRNCFNFK